MSGHWNRVTGCIHVGTVIDSLLFSLDSFKFIIHIVEIGRASCRERV